MKKFGLMKTMMKSQNPSLPPVVRVLLLFLVSWQSLFHVPDVALNALVVFFWHFLHVLSRILKNESLKHLTTFLSMTYHGLLRSIKLDSKGRFTSYVVCPRCSSIYDYESCYEVNNGKAISKSCDFVAFPDHPHHSQRERCGVMLLKKVRTKHKGIDLVP